jgi:hypothetical protein
VTAVHYSPRLIMKIIINLGREILLLGSVRESIMKPSETSSGKKILIICFLLANGIIILNDCDQRFQEEDCMSVLP